MFDLVIAHWPALALVAALVCVLIWLGRSSFD